MKAAVTILVFCVAGLLALGLVMLYSSGLVQGRTTFVGAGYLQQQSIACGLGLVACCGAALLDYRLLRRLALPLLGLSVVLLVVVLFSKKVNGAHRWLDLGPASFQPSELAKIALITALAWYGERYQRFMSSWKRGVVVPGLMIGLVLGLIFPEPDRGTTILLAAVAGSMLLVAGVRIQYFFPPVVLAAVGLLYSLWNDPMRIRRILSWLDLEETREGIGFQAYQAMLALGSGGWFGLGLGNGRQKLGFIPYHHTDFIFSIVGEELGLVATLLVVLAFVAIVICGLFIASRARDTFGFLLASGITLLIGLQALINIGVVTSALPNKGLPLPFISYGGSSLLITLTSVGILLSIARRARAPETLPQSRDLRHHEDNPFRAPGSAGAASEPA